MTQALVEHNRDNLPFVGDNATPIDADMLQALIERCIAKPAWHCLRWPHTISLGAELPSTTALDCPEGQVFNRDRELRWKRRKDTYTVLLLSSTSVPDTDLRALANPQHQPQAWQIRNLNDQFYPATETRFPQGITYPERLDIGQRYFIDEQTGIVQFVALRAL
jgi:hypothetical protein